VAAREPLLIENEPLEKWSVCSIAPEGHLLDSGTPFVSSTGRRGWLLICYANYVFGEDIPLVS
jgi:hypothetical protein